MYDEAIIKNQEEDEVNSQTKVIKIPVDRNEFNSFCSSIGIIWTLLWFRSQTDLDLGLE